MHARYAAHARTFFLSDFGPGLTRTRYTFTGRERDPDTSLSYYRARFFDPSIGRFISEDPIGLQGGVNSYAYVINNPVAYNDPLGLCPCMCTLELRASRIGRSVIGYHLYITTHDSCTGKTRGYRAGPGDNDKIEAIGLQFDEDFPDFPYRENDRVVVSLKIPGSCEKWDRSFTETTHLINRSQIDYSTLENNSNAFAYTALARAGVRPHGLTDALNRTLPALGVAPGWGVLLPFRTNLPPLRRP